MKHYFYPRQIALMSELSKKFGLHYAGGNDLWGCKRRMLYNSRYIYDKPADMSIDDYITKVREFKEALANDNTEVVILRLGGLRIAVCHPLLTLPCDGNGLLLSRCRQLDDFTARQYQQKFPNKCII